MSLLLEYHSDQAIPEVYLGLYPCLLSPILWERTGNVHPLVSLLRAYICKATPQQMESTVAVVGIMINYIFFVKKKSPGVYLAELYLNFFMYFDCCPSF